MLPKVIHVAFAILALLRLYEFMELFFSVL